MLLWVVEFPRVPGFVDGFTLSLEFMDEGVEPAVSEVILLLLMFLLFLLFLLLLPLPFCW